MSLVFDWSTSGMLAGDKSSQHECTSFVTAALEALYPISRGGTYCKLQLQKAPFAHQLKCTLELMQHPAARLTADACFANLLRAESVNNAALPRNPHRVSCFSSQEKWLSHFEALCSLALVFYASALYE